MVKQKERPLQSAAPPAQAGLVAPKAGPSTAICLLLALVTLAVYWLAALNGFVNYDDPDYVTSNPHVQGGLNWRNILWAFGSGHASNWHPLTWLSHMLDWQCFGDNATGHHLTSVAFHVANTLLLFLVLRRMTGAQWRSAFVAALFALHPLHVESVAWISERKDVLSTFFLLLALSTYTHYAQARALGPVSGSPLGDARLSFQRPTFYYLAALLCFALGLMSKPMVVTVPFLLLLLDYWPLDRFKTLAAVDARRLHSSNSKGSESPYVACYGLIVEKVPFFALSLASSVVTFLVQRKGGAVSASLSLGERIANSFVSCARYLGKILWPLDLSVLYPHPGDWPAWQVVSAAALVLGMSVVVILLARRRPYLPVGWFWFLGGLVPVIGLIQVGIQSMADRYTYVPIIGVWIALVWGLCDLVPASRVRDRWFAIGSGFAILTCASLTARQILFWRNSESLFRRAVTVTSRNYLAYNNLGFYLAGRGRAEEALVNYRKALDINPAYDDALNNIGYVLAGQKKPAEAIPYYEAALRIRPNHVEVHNNLGNALSETAQIPAAIEQYRFVLRAQPDHADAHNNLGIALAMQGNLDEAIEHFRAAIRIKPKYASARSNLGNAFAAQRKFDEAISEYQESLRLNPADAQAHNNLGNVLTEQNRLDEAIEQYLQALRLNADNPEAQFNLGMALARQGNRDAACAHYREALRLKPDYSAAQQQLRSLATQTNR
jgi:tetratricopeptide (TPR) repeat protein